MAMLKHSGLLATPWELYLALVTAECVSDHSLDFWHFEHPCTAPQNTPCTALPVRGLFFTFTLHPYRLSSSYTF